MFACVTRSNLICPHNYLVFEAKYLGCTATDIIFSVYPMLGRAICREALAPCIKKQTAAIPPKANQRTNPQSSVVKSRLTAGLIAHTCAQLKAIEWVVQIATIIITWPGNAHKVCNPPRAKSDKSTSNGKSNLVTANR